MPFGRMVRIVGTLALGTFWLLAFALAGAVGLELVLRIRSHWRTQTDRRPRYERLAQAYDRFGVQHLHPQYLFFFPRDPGERVALSNETCSIDADGFRGPGPAHADGRRLAFLLGGSVTFGTFASSDATTITGYLNRMQNQYFFVNAGVPDWNSTQEVFRMAFQLVGYHPALVITYDGANDAGLLEQNSRGPVRYPAGTPDSFAELSALVDERGSASRRRAAADLFEYLFPSLKHSVDARLEKARSAATLPEGALQEGVTRYLSNLALIRDLATTQGARFIAVFDAVAHLHQHLESGLPDVTSATDRFHRGVLTKYGHEFEFHDLGNVFDQHFATVPVMTRDITDATIFVDEVHLTDTGNEIVARELSRLIR